MPQSSSMRAVLLVCLTFCATCAHASAVARAQALVREGKGQEAVAVLRERLRARPDDIAARRVLVRVLGISGDVPQARAESAELAHWMPPDSPTAHIELGHALELAHQYEEALAEYDEAASIAPASPDGPREGGLRCAHWGLADAAGPRLEEAVRRGARDAETWHALGLVRLHLGDVDGAEEAYRAGTASDPQRPENWLGLATVAMVRGDAQSALVAYGQVLARRPYYAPAELGRAWALARLGRRDEALRALNHAEQLGAPTANVARQRSGLSVPSP
jgi:tetratricopeptide (TPR) repeat protein